ncbi:hypothetical protein K788_0004187 (plasmid) [Paraburkholderia caribensis MBA4]|uniref:Uncharacterized protein n=1 Tax=Paraburkholderia caribensis MBA4 TaxID=1323664 RepID=A0A0P0RPC8_9BURK|nr:hypothetical protein K788_0004187 [Paraburkholderia caribensis MBA4]
MFDFFAGIRDVVLRRAVVWLFERLRWHPRFAFALASAFR